MEEACGHLSLAEVGTEEFLQRLTSQITEMVSAKITQGEGLRSAGGVGEGDPLLWANPSPPVPWRFMAGAESFLSQGSVHPVPSPSTLQPSCRCLEVTVMRSPRHHLRPQDMAAPAPPPASRSHLQSPRMGTPGERCWEGGGGKWEGVMWWMKSRGDTSLGHNPEHPNTPRGSLVSISTDELGLF